MSKTNTCPILQAVTDYENGLSCDSKRHGTGRKSRWAYRYIEAYKMLSANPSIMANTAQSISAFLAEHPKVPVRFEGHLLTPTEAQAKLALSEYANVTFNIFLRRHLLEIIRE